MRTIYTLSFLFTFLFSFAQEDSIIYPQAPKSDIKDTIWGTVISDPYRILEKNNVERDQWVATEQRITDQYFKAISKTTQKIEKDMGSIGFSPNNIPIRSGPYYIQYAYNPITESYDLIYKDYLRSKPQVLVSPTLIKNKLKSFSNYSISPDGKYCALMYSENGSDWQHIRVFNINNMWLMKDDISNVKYSDITWYGNGFFYSRFDSVDQDNKYTDIQINQKIYYHTIGTNSSKDSLFFKDEDYPYNTFSINVLSNQRFIIIKELYTDQNISITYCKDTKTSKAFKPIIKDNDGVNTNIITAIEDTFMAVTTAQGGYNGQLVEFDLKNPSKWAVVVPNQERFRIKQVRYYNGNYIVIYQEHFDETLAVFSRNGDLIKSIPTPYGSSIDMICYAPDQNSIIIVKQYYVAPPVGQLFSLKDFTLSPIQKLTSTQYDIANYQFLETNYRSKDGTLIPIYIVTHKNYSKMSHVPALLSVYGGFDISQSPHFDPAVLTFINSGGIFAFANVRGGANSVKNWHKEGAKLKKQNTIDDIYYAAKFLADSGIADPNKIGIIGGSNGGLVIAATINQHPEVFRAAVLNVGAYDMVRFENFTVGAYDRNEYGSIRDSIEYKNILSYSPLHNIKSGTNYPAMLVVTSQFDDRVPPFHSYKFVATLQEKTKSKNPILLLVNKNSGHLQSYNAGLDYSFLFKELNMKHTDTDFYFHY